jgi:hypothetical protein
MKAIESLDLLLDELSQTKQKWQSESRLASENETEFALFVTIRGRSVKISCENNNLVMTLENGATASLPL